MNRRTKAIISKLLNNGKRSRTILACVIMSLGYSMLLVSLLVLCDVAAMNNGPKNLTSSVYLPVSWQITDKSDDVKQVDLLTAVRAAPEVQDCATVEHAGFAVYAELGGGMRLGTELPLASIPERMLDNVPENWHWEPGQTRVPLILPTDFLDIYNYMFAGGQGLPQLSKRAIQNIGIRIAVGSEQRQQYTAYIAGFSDRYSVVLAPEEFVRYGNAQWSHEAQASQQVIAKVKKENVPKLLGRLTEQGLYAGATNDVAAGVYRTLQIVASITTAVAVLLLVSGVLLILTLTERNLATNRTHLIRLWEMGYSKRTISNVVSQPLALASSTALLVASGISICLQVVLVKRIDSDELVWYGNPYFVGAVCLLAMLNVLLIRQSVQRYVNSIVQE